MAEEKIEYSGIEITETERSTTKDFGEKKGKFTCVIPMPTEKLQIVVATSRALGGLSQEAISPEEREYARMIVTLNFVLKNTPKWWNGAENCPDDTFLFDLWDWFLKCEENFKEFLKKNS